MDNAQKAIMIGVGLFITIIIISAVLLVVNLGTGLVDDATAQLGSMSTTLQNQLMQTYDGKIISGTQVRAAINQYAKDPDVSIIVFGAQPTTATAASIVARTGGQYIHAVNGTPSTTPTSVLYKGGGVADWGTQTNALKDSAGKAVTVSNTAVNVIKSTSGSTTTYTFERTAASTFTDKTDVTGAYINTANNYHASVIRTDNDAVIGIAFQVSK